MLLRENFHASLGQDTEGPDSSQLPQLGARHHPLSWHIYYPCRYISHTRSQVKNTLSLEHLFQLSLGKNRMQSQQLSHSLQERGSVVPVCFLWDHSRHRAGATGWLYPYPSAHKEVPLSADSVLRSTLEKGCLSQIKHIMETQLV